RYEHPLERCDDCVVDPAVARQRTDPGHGVGEEVEVEALETQLDGVADDEGEWRQGEHEEEERGTCGETVLGSAPTFYRPARDADSCNRKDGRDDDEVDGALEPREREQQKREADCAEDGARKPPSRQRAGA